MGLSDILHSLLKQEALWREQTINLNASENYTSPLVKKIIGLHPSYDFYQFPPSGGIIKGPWHFSGPPYFEQIEQYINILGQDLLNCAEIDTRPKGGQAAEITALMALANRGDSVFYVQESDGGHFGLNFVSQKMGVQLIPISFDNENYQIDILNTLKQMKQVWNKNTTRKIIIINQSFIIRQQPLKEFVETVKNQFFDAIVTYDVSHTLGLIIGKQLLNPIIQNIDFIHGSTHKTFPGPQKAFIGFPTNFNKTLQDAIKFTLSPGLQSNCGTSETLALAVALEEMKIYGKDYANAVCKHAKYLAGLLNKAGFNIVGKKIGFTETHQIWIAIGDEYQTWTAFANLHDAGIRAYPAYLPYIKSWGLRIGTNAITRLGFEVAQIQILAKWIEQILIDRISPVKIKNEIKQLMKQFPTKKIKYAFTDMTSSLCSQVDYDSNPSMDYSLY